MLVLIPFTVFNLRIPMASALEIQNQGLMVRPVMIDTAYFLNAVVTTNTTARTETSTTPPTALTTPASQHPCRKLGIRSLRPRFPDLFESAHHRLCKRSLTKRSPVRLPPFKPPRPPPPPRPVYRPHGGGRKPPIRKPNNKQSNKGKASDKNDHQQTPLNALSRVPKGKPIEKSVPAWKQMEGAATRTPRDTWGKKIKSTAGAG